MSWVDLLENPDSVRRLYKAPPSLDHCELRSFSLDRDGPTARLSLGLANPPEQLPPRWSRFQVNAVAMELELLALEEISLSGWTTHPVVGLSIERLDERLHVSTVSPDVQLTLVCRWIRLKRIEPYQMAAPAQLDRNS